MAHTGKVYATQFKFIEFFICSRFECWSQQEKHMVVWVESAVLDDTGLLKDKKFQKIKDKLVTFK